MAKYQIIFIKLEGFLKRIKKIIQNRQQRYLLKGFYSILRTSNNILTIKRDISIKVTKFELIFKRLLSPINTLVIKRKQAFFEELRKNIDNKERLKKKTLNKQTNVGKSKGNKKFKKFKIEKLSTQTKNNDKISIFSKKQSEQLGNNKIKDTDFMHKLDMENELLASKIQMTEDYINEKIDSIETRIGFV